MPIKKYDTKGYLTHLNNDLEVFSDCYNKECSGITGKQLLLNNHVLLGTTKFNHENPEDILVKGNLVNTVGMVKLSIKIINRLINIYSMIL